MSWTNKFLRHCSDEQLVGHMDGELPLWESCSVKAHLTVCYQCRAQRKALEDQALRVATLLEHDDYPGGRHVAASFEDFLARQEEILAETAPPARSLFTLPRLAWGGALAAALIIAAVAFLQPRPPETLDVAEVMAGIQTAESAVASTAGPVHQVLLLTTGAGPGQQPSEPLRLEIWSDTENNRYAASIGDSAGKLQRAVWRPDAATEFQYTEAAGLQRHAAANRRRENLLDDLISVASAEGDLRDLAVEWSTTRVAYPLLIANDLVRFARQPGATVRVEQFPGVPGRALLIAERTVDGIQVRLSLEIDLSTYRSRRVTFEFGGPAGPKLIDLVVERNERVPRAQLVNAVFEPEPSLLASHTPRQVLRPELPTRTTPAPIPMAGRIVAEARLRYAFHNLGECQSGSVEISGDPGGIVGVKGVALSQDQLDRWTTALSTVDLPAGWQVDLRLFSMDDHPTELVQSETIEGAPVSSGPSPLEAELHAHFSSMEDIDESEASQRAVALTNQVLFASQSALADAWALRRLAERYPTPDELSGPARRLLEAMLSDHTRRLGDHARTLHDSLNPVWGPTAGAGPEITVKSTAGWNRQVLELFNTVESLHSGLFQRVTAGETPSAAQTSLLTRDLLSSMTAIERTTALVRKRFQQHSAESKP